MIGSLAEVGRAYSTAMPRTACFVLKSLPGIVGPHLRVFMIH